MAPHAFRHQLNFPGVADRGTAAVSARHSIGMAIEKEIDEVMKIIQQGVQNSDEFGASLNKANEALPDAEFSRHTRNAGLRSDGKTTSAWPRPRVS
jgi:hypothetical protein